MRARFAAAAFALSLLPAGTAVAAASIEGHYEVEGRIAGSKSAYRGGVDVARTGTTYKVTWRTQSGNYVGTGVLDGDAFAVIYVDAQQKTGAAPGLVLYRLQADGSMLGTYTDLGGTTTAPEIWRRGPGN
jgi:hypothetical protein